MITSVRGYTLIEVMIVLAVTGALFISAVGVFSGRTDSTQFSQAIYDLQSQVQSYANQVSTGTFPATSAYSCQAAGNPVVPTLSVANQAQSTNQDCLYVGRAILAIPGSNQLYVYSVLGLRDLYQGSTDTGQTVTSLAQASPDVAKITSTNTYVLSEAYQFLPGLTILSSKYYSTATTNQSAELLDIYSTFQNTGSSGQSITAYTIPGLSSSDIGTPPANSAVDSALESCIQLQTSPNAACATPQIIGNYGWRLCIQDSGTNGRKAELTVISAATGIDTKIAIGSCSS